MTVEQKIKEIKNAVKLGLPKRRIDLKGNGRNVRRLLKGEEVSQACIEEIYASLLSYRENPHVLKERMEKYQNSYPEVSQEEKVKAIKKAAQSGAKKNDLDPFAGGDAVRKLLRGKSVGVCKINEMYANFLSSENASPTQSVRKRVAKYRRLDFHGSSSHRKENNSHKGSDKKEKENQSQSNEHLKVKLLEQDRQIATLSAKVRELEAQVTELRVILCVNQTKPLKVLGLTVTQKVDIVGQKRYRRWYAIYRNNGIRRWIYIGKDLNKAEEKIQAWLEKNRGSNDDPSRTL